MEEISFDLVGKVLEEDIYSNLDILLLKKGTVLSEINILLLKKHRYKKVRVSEDLSFRSLYLQNIQHIEELFSDLVNNKKLDIREWFEKKKNLARIVQKDVSVIEKMYTIEADSTIFRHSSNVGLLAFYLGKLLRYSFKNKILLWQMGVLHDIGKLQINSNLLTKKNEDFTEEELHEYKKHPELGWTILKEVKGINALILNAARHHHENIDGSGYPKGIKVKYLPVMVQIITVANKIDKILLNKGNMITLLNELIEETRNNQLNPAIVVPFVRHMLRKHVGEQVVLSDGSIAELVFIYENEPSQPLLYVNANDTFVDLRKYHKLKIVDFA